MKILFERKKIKVYLWVLTISTATLLTIGYVFGIEKNFVLPVDKMNTKSYNQKSFWFGPWGQSIVHKGVDIFGKIIHGILKDTESNYYLASVKLNLENLFLVRFSVNVFQFKKKTDIK